MQRLPLFTSSDSRILCGPVDGRGAKMPVSLSSIQCFGARRRFRCFLGPRAIVGNRLAPPKLSSATRQLSELPPPSRGLHRENFFIFSRIDPGQKNVPPNDDLPKLPVCHVVP